MASQYAEPARTFGTTLRFSPYAWAKLMFMQKRGKTEVAGCGITETSDPLFVTDFVLIGQESSAVTFDLDTDDLADHLDRMLDAGLVPWQVANILIHTHPGNSPKPSETDEDNFVDAFSSPDWAIMMIVAENGETYCRLKLNTGPGVTKILKVEVDWSQPFSGSSHPEWAREYDEKVREYDWTRDTKGWDGFQIEPDGSVSVWDDKQGLWYWYDHIERKWYVEDGSQFKEVKEPDPSWTKKATDCIESRKQVCEGKS